MLKNILTSIVDSRKEILYYFFFSVGFLSCFFTTAETYLNSSDHGGNTTYRTVLSSKEIQISSILCFGAIIPILIKFIIDIMGKLFMSSIYNSRVSFESLFVQVIVLFAVFLPSILIFVANIESQIQRQANFYHLQRYLFLTAIFVSIYGLTKKNLNEKDIMTNQRNYNYLIVSQFILACAQICLSVTLHIYSNNNSSIRLLVFSFVFYFFITGLAFIVGTIYVVSFLWNLWISRSFEHITKDNLLFAGYILISGIDSMFRVHVYFTGNFIHEYSGFGKCLVSHMTMNILLTFIIVTLHCLVNSFDENNSKWKITGEMKIHTEELLSIFASLVEKSSNFDKFQSKRRRNFGDKYEKEKELLLQDNVQCGIDKCVEMCRSLIFINEIELNSVNATKCFPALSRVMASRENDENNENIENEKSVLNKELDFNYETDCKIDVMSVDASLDSDSVKSLWSSHSPETVQNKQMKNLESTKVECGNENGNEHIIEVKENCQFAGENVLSSAPSLKNGFHSSQVQDFVTNNSQHEETKDEEMFGGNIWRSPLVNYSKAKKEDNKSIDFENVNYVSMNGADEKLRSRGRYQDVEKIHASRLFSPSTADLSSEAQSSLSRPEPLSSSSAWSQRQRLRLSQTQALLKSLPGAPVNEPLGIASIASLINYSLSNYSSNNINVNNLPDSTNNNSNIFSSNNSNSNSNSIKDKKNFPGPSFPLSVTFRRLNKNPSTSKSGFSGRHISSKKQRSFRNLNPPSKLPTWLEEDGNSSTRGSPRHDFANRMIEKDIEIVKPKAKVLPTINNSRWKEVQLPLPNFIARETELNAEKEKNEDENMEMDELSFGYTENPLVSLHSSSSKSIGSKSFKNSSNYQVQPIQIEATKEIEMSGKTSFYKNFFVKSVSGKSMMSDDLSMVSVGSYYQQRNSSGGQARVDMPAPIAAWSFDQDDSCSFIPPSPSYCSSRRDSRRDSQRNSGTAHPFGLTRVSTLSKGSFRESASFNDGRGVASNDDSEYYDEDVSSVGTGKVMHVQLAPPSSSAAHSSSLPSAPLLAHTHAHAEESRELSAYAASVARGAQLEFRSICVPRPRAQELLLLSRARSRFLSARILVQQVRLDCAALNELCALLADCLDSGLPLAAPALSLSTCARTGTRSASRAQDLLLFSDALSSLNKKVADSLSLCDQVALKLRDDRDEDDRDDDNEDRDENEAEKEVEREEARPWFDYDSSPFQSIG